MRRARVLAGFAATLALLGGGFLVVRDSSLVAVEEVAVHGLTGPDAPKLQRTLEQAAREMTTLNVDQDALLSVVGHNPVVRGLKVRTDFPHGLRIDVLERTPVATVQVGETRTLVSKDGELLRGARLRDLAVVPLKRMPVTTTVSDRNAAQAIAALAAAPPQLRPKVERAFVGPHGLTLWLEEGPALRFGSGARLEAKWMAAARVLADAGSRGATYVDLRYPERPAAGGMEDPLTQVDPGEADRSVTTPGVTTPTPPAATPTQTATTTPPTTP